MKSKAKTVAAYLNSLPPDRRQAIEIVRKHILDHLPKGLEECMQYGIIAYCVPHSVWEHGHHTNPKLQLMYMGLSSQKNDMVVYMLMLLHNTSEREAFVKAWKATGRTAYLEVGGMGCCLRFKKLEDLSLDVIAQAMRRIPIKTYLDNHIQMLEKIGKSPDGKPIKQRKAQPATISSDDAVTRGRSVAAQASHANTAVQPIKSPRRTRVSKSAKPASTTSTIASKKKSPSNKKSTTRRAES